jgi:nucleotide-binding universal stress UspA family protein
MGSVAREVVRRAGRPVFLVRPDLPPLRRAHRRILVPLAEPAGAEAVLKIVEALARQADSEVILLHVLPFPRVADPVTGFNPVILKPLELPSAEWLDPFVDLLTHHGIRAVKSVPAGEPDEILLRESRERNVDLIVLRTSGRKGLARLAVGRVAEQVLKKADRAVLLFHRVEE